MREAYTQLPLFADPADDRRWKTCAVCGAPFRVKPSHYDKKTYCSRPCMARGYAERLRGRANPNYRDRAPCQCAYCGADFQTYTRTRRYCRQSCGQRALSTRRRFEGRCPQCGAGFVAARSTQRSCSKHCQDRANRPPPRPRPQRPPQPPTVPRREPRPTPPAPPPRRDPRRRDARPPITAPPLASCRACGALFARSTPRAVFCPGCVLIERTCAACGVVFTVRRSTGHDKVTCSAPCWRKWRAVSQQGPRSHRWQGGKTKATTIFRGSQEYADWRRGVFARDGYTCQLCRRVGTKLAAHHIRRVATHPDLALDPTNGITLCWPCHRSIRGKEDASAARFLAHTQAGEE